ncbi:MAG: hypothetical protein U5K79_22605 [Cyclobacteriaceae bacterium]|nr:hypothetical protein [Cyclobacteriaceae bacterium]
MEKPTKLRADVSYSYQGKKPSGSINITAANTDLKHQISPTGLTVGEPNQQWHIDNFTSHTIGEINFPKPGIYEISMSIEIPKDSPVEFQWLWLAGE